MNDIAIKDGYMRSIFRFIESNLPAELDITLLSNTGYVSYDKLYRDFYSVTGHSVKEYVRKRRLSNALALIKTSEMELTGIAVQCGYSSHQALCRAVRGTLGLTPSQYRREETYFFFPPFDGVSLHSVTVSNDTIPRALRLPFYHSSLTSIENAAVGTFLRLFPDYSGRIFGRNGRQRGSKFCYELYLTDTSRDYSALTSHGFERPQEVPEFAAMFATSTIRNDEAKINAAWDYLYADWLRNSMFEYTDEPYCEEYILKNGRAVKLRLYLPIRKRAEDTKISVVPNPGLRFVVARAEGRDAEERASQTVMGYLAANYPYVINTSKELYVRKEGDAYLCGVRVNPELRLADDENVASVATEEGQYLVLESSVTGDYDRYADLLCSFARDNGIDADRTGLFALYDARESFVNLKIKMYLPLKIRKK